MDDAFLDKTHRQSDPSHNSWRHDRRFPGNGSDCRRNPRLGAAAPPKPIGLTINYLRPGRALDSYATVSIVKQGRRIVAFEAKAWQDDPDKPIASTFGHFMLRATPR
jgi:Acyl-CoA thioesterase N-terminal domain